MSWKGTAVPNSGTVDKLYLNDKVSFQEIYNLLSSIEYAPYDDNGFFEIYIALNCDGGSMFGILKKNNTDTPRGIEYDINVDGNTVWTSVNDEGFTSYGLNVLATQQNYGYIPNTGEALDNGSIGTKVYEVGLQNDKISSLFSITPFEEEANYETVEELLTDVADAIREKKGIKKEDKWVGTEVPNTGHIEKLYFNTELSNEEVEKLVRNLQPTIILFGVSAYLLLNSAEYSAGQFDTCMIMWKDDGIGISWESSTNKIPIFFTSPTLASENKVEPTGWQTFDNPIEINVDVVNESPNGFPSGSQNNKLTSLVSITPFEKKTTGLIPALDFPSEIRSIETGGELLEPTAVPISGMVEKVYFNFNVDVSKMVEVIKNLSFIDAGLGVPVYPIISNIAGTDGLLFVKIDDNFYYLQRGETHLIASISISGTEPEYEIKIIDNRDDSNFYKNDFTQPMEFGFENMVGQLVTQFPTYRNDNELLKEMISITPIQKIGGEGIEGIIEVEQLPVVEYSGTVVPNSGMVETIHFNTNLSTNEVVKELEKLTYVETPLAPFPVSVLFATEDFSKVIIATKYTYTSGDLSGQVDYDIYEFTNFGQDSETTTTLFSTMLTQPEDAGWKVENGYYIEANKNVINDYSGLPIGTENDKISSLFSLTPIELNIDTSKIYFVNAIFGNILLYEEGTSSPFEDLMGGNGTLEYYYAKTKPTTDIKEVDMQNMIFRVYYIEDENDIFVYGDLAGDGSKIWMTLETLVFEGRASFGGYINDISQANESGYYAMPKESFYKFSNGWVEYKYGGIKPDGRLTVTQNGEYDITSYKTVDVNIEDKSLEVHKMYLFSKSINWQSISWDKFNFTLSLNGHIFREKTITGLDSGKLIIPECVSGIGEYCFYHCQSITEVSFNGNSCVSIGQWCFSGCKKLTSIIFPDDIKTIHVSVASGCDLLTNVVLPKNCTRIEKNAFEICDNLTYVEIPATVTYIGLQAFQATSSNDKLLTVKMLGSTPPILGDISRGFTLVFLVDKILIPSGSLADYEEDWSMYAGKFEEY